MLAYSFRCLDGIAHVLDVIDDYCKLIATQPRNNVTLPETRLEPARRRHKQLVTDLMTQTVIYDLEAIKV